MKSKATKNCTIAAVILTAISVLLNVVPMSVYIIKGYIVAEPVQKTTLTITVVVAVILLFINILSKLKLRSVFWILLIGISICVANVMPLLITMAVSIILDEFIFDPLAKRYREKARINKEIDKRQ